MASEVVQTPVRELRMGENIRKNLNIGGLKDSVAEEGILSPILVYRNPTGQLTVLDGHRRLQAAMQAELDTVPTVEVDATERDREIMRQLVLNEAREDLSDLDRVDAVRQLVLFGIDESMIAKKTGKPKPQVEKLAKVARSAPVVSLMKDEQMSFDLALRMIDAEDDGVDLGILQAMVREQFEESGGTIEPWRFNNLLYDAKRETLIRAKGRDLEAQGIRWVDMDAEDFERGEFMLPVSELEVNQAEHEECPGRVVGVSANYRNELNLVEFCEDFTEYGHEPRAQAQERVEADAREAENRRKRDEKQAAIRAAADARREFITGVLRGDKKPILFDYLVILSFSYRGGYSDIDSKFALSAIGARTDSPELAEVLFDWMDKHPGKTWKALLAYAFANLEAAASWSYYSVVKPYLEFLEHSGYVLAPVEEEMIGRMNSGGEGDDSGVEDAAETEKEDAVADDAAEDSSEGDEQ
ncbi:MAG: ParB N-terminal domain-containing protein [Mobiluncus sp.]|uniref:ParB/RepB/Spo0J family partition protein n=1 Tax=Mobiluncus sp. TaxID=47293 RepID=UPI0025870915|nr:ParB N-terminal domain-containing protein [Mobiluncus sp.]MCI6584049.1 ParB N-terminal domain-containing protein [Mobiluncus sp.]